MCSIGFCELVFNFENENALVLNPRKRHRLCRHCGYLTVWLLKTFGFFLEGSVNKGRLCVYQDFCAFWSFLMSILKIYTNRNIAIFLKDYVLSGRFFLYLYIYIYITSSMTISQFFFKVSSYKYTHGKQSRLHEKHTDLSNIEPKWYDKQVKF